jgi:hypothetical protein
MLLFKKIHPRLSGGLFQFVVPIPMLVQAAIEPLGFSGPDRGLVFGYWKTHELLQLFGPHGKLSGRFFL